MMHGELKVTKGDPTDEELAALVAVLSAQTAKPEPVSYTHLTLPTKA